jgi:hypothetical protein
MKCAVCKVDLLSWELPQRMKIGNTSYPVPGLCDRCARANTGRGGSRESLQRLVDGTLDEAEVARVKAATPMEWDDPPEEKKP